MRDREHPGDAQLVAWFDNELPESERAAVEAHVAECGECRKRADQIGEVSLAVAAWGEEVYRAQAKLPARPRRFRHWPRYAGAVGALAASLAVVLLVPGRPELPGLPLPPAPAAQAIAFAKPPAVKVVARVRRAGQKPGGRAEALPHKMEFVALPYSDERLPISEAAVVRVELPRAAMRLVGIAVEPERRDDRVRADVIVGADGLARAIRFLE
jgi:hypothetical protein